MAKKFRDLKREADEARDKDKETRRIAFDAQIEASSAKREVQRERVRQVRTAIAVIEQFINDTEFRL